MRHTFGVIKRSAKAITAFRNRITAEKTAGSVRSSTHITNNYHDFDEVSRALGNVVHQQFSKFVHLITAAETKLAT